MRWMGGEKSERLYLSIDILVFECIKNIYCSLFQVLKTVRKEILKGCKIVFTGVIPIQCQPENHYYWRLAEQLGATFSTEVDESVTHVVSMNDKTEKSRQAALEKKFLVHPRWIEAANYLWRKPPEENFPVSS